MPLRRYGVLRCRPVRRRLATRSETHYHILATDGSASYRLSINVQSQLAPSDLEYLVVDPFDHPLVARLDQLPFGWTQVQRRPDDLALDYVRADLFDPQAMRPLAPIVPGPANDLNEAIDAYVAQAIDDRATLYAFGTRWGPEWRVRDHVFGFKPRNGVHDIHMNQGNAHPFTAQNGPWQDGALLLQFADRCVAIFLKFQSQAWRTHDRTGHRLDSAPREQPRCHRPRYALRGTARPPRR